MELMELIARAPWREAVTYRETWPHEYVLIKQDKQRELLAAICARIANGEGIEGRFFSRTSAYLFIGEYKYWPYTSCDEIDLDATEDEVVLNRAPLYRDRRDFVIRVGDTGIRVESEKDEPMTETSEHDTLLAHLARKLSDRHEDIAVEALGYIFRSSQARRVLEEMLRARGADVGSIEKVRTQATGKEGARPDLAGVDRTGLERVLIEAKFWAGLTGNQPTAYLERLPTNMPSALLFVAPAARLETLWDELCQRAGVNGPRPAAETSEEFRSVTMAGARHLMLTSWTHLLERLDGAGDEHTMIAVQQLRGLTKMKTEDFPPFHPLHPDEFDPKVPRLLLNLQRLVDDATTRAVAAGYASTEGLKVTPQATGYGRYLYLADAGAWFGVDFDSWAWDSYPDTPLWLRFSEWDRGMRKPLSETHGALEPLEQKDSPDCFDDDGALYVPIELPVHAEYDEVLEAVVRRLQEVSDLISAAEGASSPTG